MLEPWQKRALAYNTCTPDHILLNLAYFPLTFFLTDWVLPTVQTSLVAFWIESAPSCIIPGFDAECILGKRLPSPILIHKILRRKIQVSGRENRRKKGRQGETTLARLQAPGGEGT